MELQRRVKFPTENSWARFENATTNQLLKTQSKIFNYPSSFSSLPRRLSHRDRPTIAHFFIFAVEVGTLYRGKTSKHWKHYRYTRKVQIVHLWKPSKHRKPNRYAVKLRIVYLGKPSKRRKHYRYSVYILILSVPRRGTAPSNGAISPQTGFERCSAWNFDRQMIWKWTWRKWWEYVTKNPQNMPPNGAYENCSHFWDFFDFSFFSICWVVFFLKPMLIYRVEYTESESDIQIYNFL